MSVTEYLSTDYSPDCDYVDGVLEDRNVGEKDHSAPPFLCIEILSPADQMSRVLVKVGDYLAFGVARVWVIDPRKRSATIYTATEAYSPVDGILRTENPDLAVALTDLF